MGALPAASGCATREGINWRTDTMKRTLFAALAALTLSSSAQALDLNITTTRIPNHWYLDRGPRIINVPKNFFGSDADIAKWEEFCQPRRTYDEYGVVRLVYAHKGCEFGRSE